LLRAKALNHTLIVLRGALHVKRIRPDQTGGAARILTVPNNRPTPGQVPAPAKTKRAARNSLLVSLMTNLKELVIPTSAARRNLLFLRGEKQIPRTSSHAPLAANVSE